MPDVQFGSTVVSPEAPSSQVIPEDEQSPYAASLGASGLAFGSDAFLVNLTNIFTEFASLGAIGAPFSPHKNAIKAVENLNNEFIQFFQKASELRDSVFAQKELKSLTPKPASLFVGADDAESAAKNLYLRINSAVQDIERALSSEEIPLSATGAGSLSAKRQMLVPLKKLRNGYAILAGIDSPAINTGEIDQDALLDDIYTIMEETE